MLFSVFTEEIIFQSLFLKASFCSVKVVIKNPLFSVERNRMQLCSCGICSILNSGLPYFFLDQTQFLKPSILLSMGSTHLNSETNARHSYIKPLNPGTILPMGAYWGGGGLEFSPPRHKKIELSKGKTNIENEMKRKKV